MKSKLLLPMIKVLRNPACYFYSALPHRKCSSDANIRQYQKQDIISILQMIKEEPWNISINEVDFAYTFDPTGGYVCTTSTGKILGACIVYNIDNETSSGVAYVVDPTQRGKSIGRTLFDLGLKHMSSRNIIGTAAQQMAPKYVADGYYHLGDGIHRYAKLPPFHWFFKKADKSFDIVSYSPLLWSKLLEYESTVCKPVQPRFLKWWINQPSSLTLVSLKNNSVCGYGVIYEGTNTSRISPLFADTTDIAQSLLQKLICEFTISKNRGFTIDLSAKNEASIQMARDMNLDLVRVSTFIYNNKDQLSYHPKIYCRTNWQMT